MTTSLMMNDSEYRTCLQQLTTSFLDIPTHAKVRLAKPTSNLFRARQKLNHPGLDVSGLNRVIRVDPDQRIAEVAGMCTYEDFVDAVLPFGLAPTVVPQLKTITVGGAITGMGIESASFRAGLPHEAVREMDILIADGSIITASPEKNSDLFYGFPNSYGSLGYCVKVTVELDRVPEYIKITHLRYHSIEQLYDGLAQLLANGNLHDKAIDYLDGVVFSPEELYLCVAQKVDDQEQMTQLRNSGISDYTKEKIYYRSIQHDVGEKIDFLTTRDYFWRWDTDWFWCSRAFGAQNSKIRRWWPKKYLRSSFYWKLVSLDHRYDLGNKLNKLKGLPRMERVVQDVEVPLDQLSEFITWFCNNIPVSPIWLCPLKLTSSVADQPWTLYPLMSDSWYVNVGFWSAVPEHGEDLAYTNKLIEGKVQSLQGHKSLYSEVFYTREQFDHLYNGSKYRILKNTYDPHGRFLDVYEKVVNKK